YKLLLTMHIMVSVGWLGVVFAKVTLGLAAITTSAPNVAAALYVATESLNVAFPPLAIGTLVTGVLLSLGTRWGLFQHYWVATKLALTVGVITTAVQLGGRLQEAISAPSEPAVDGGTILGIAAAPVALLLSLSVAHLLMLGAAAVVSVYKPWGKTWFGRRKVVGRRIDSAILSAIGHAMPTNGGQRLSGERAG
ncbi:MAG: hypothetical protein ACRDJN_30990, partial [Chloroflexota bacterium]